MMAPHWKHAVRKGLPAREFPFTITMLLLTESTLHFLNLKPLFSKDEKSTVEGRIKNWNDVVVSATVPSKVYPSSFPRRQTPLPPNVFPIEPPTPPRATVNHLVIHLTLYAYVED